ncbi:hypothetical protein ACJX0J_016250, partial [Zea mays]
NGSTMSGAAKEAFSAYNDENKQEKNNRLITLPLDFEEEPLTHQKRRLNRVMNFFIILLSLLTLQKKRRKLHVSIIGPFWYKLRLPIQEFFMFSTFIYNNYYKSLAKIGKSEIQI